MEREILDPCSNQITKYEGLEGTWAKNEVLKDPTIENLHDYKKSYLKTNPNMNVSVIRTNNMVNEKLPGILKSLKSIIDQIIQALLECDVVASEVIIISDNVSLNGE